MKTPISISIALAASLAMAQTVTMNGRTVSTHVRSINGSPYVSLQDMARALGMTVLRKGDGYVLIAAGGATQVRGKREGKLGDKLFTGDWGFTVVSEKETPAYVRRYGERDTINPEKAADKLVVVACQVRNGHNKRELLHFTNSFAEGSKTSLTDTEGQSYPVKDFDVHYTYYNWASEALPGGSIDFALVFEVPQEAKPQDLVYSIFRYDDRGDPSKMTTVRVHLSK